MNNICQNSRIGLELTVENKLHMTKILHSPDRLTIDCCRWSRLYWASLAEFGKKCTLGLDLSRKGMCISLTTLIQLVK